MSQAFSGINTPTFSTPVISSYLPAYEDGTDRVFQNVGIYNSDARELPRKNHTTFRTRQKFEIKNVYHGLNINKIARYLAGLQKKTYSEISIIRKKKFEKIAAIMEGSSFVISITGTNRANTGS